MNGVFTPTLFPDSVVGAEPEVILHPPSLGLVGLISRRRLAPEPTLVAAALVTGSSRAKGLPKGETLAQTSSSGILRSVGRWLPHESGAFERIRPHLTLLRMREYS